MIIRKLILAVVLLTNIFAQNAASASSGFRSTLRATANSAFAQKAAPDTSGFDASYKLSLPGPIQDKNFYLLSLFQRDGDVRRLLRRDKALKLDRKSTRLNSS